MQKNGAVLVILFSGYEHPKLTKEILPCVVTPYMLKTKTHSQYSVIRIKWHLN